MIALLASAASRFGMFGANIYLLIGLLVVGGLLVLVVVSIWTGLKIVWWRRQRRKADGEERRGRIAPDGRPYPPAGRGVCGRCARASETVYHLPGGERLCPACYALRTAVNRRGAENAEDAEKAD